MILDQRFVLIAEEKTLKKKQIYEWHAYAVGGSMHTCTAAAQEYS